MQKSVDLNSIQNFGYNRFNRSHSIIGSYNAGIVYPLGCFDVPIGTTIQAAVDAFMRSSALVDPSFLDADINIGHYFVSYEAIDRFYRQRCQAFKGDSTNVPLPAFIAYGNASNTGGIVLSELKAAILRRFGPGSLADHLGFGLEDDLFDRYSSDDEGVIVRSSPSLPIAPFAAYQMIIDRFFRNHRIFDAERTRRILDRLFPNYATTVATWDFYDFYGLGESSSTDVEELFELKYAQWEPDYFTTARPTAGGPDIGVPQGEDATIHNLLDAMLLQKVADMLERGGYSYNDFCRILYGVDPGDESAEYPIFLGGGSQPLQISTVVNQSYSEVPSAALGTQAGNVNAYIRPNETGFSRRMDRAGIYMPCMWIRPQTYYTSGISPIFFKKTIGDSLIPQLADMQDAPIYVSELSAGSNAFFDGTPYVDVGDGSESFEGYDYEQRVFGYKDRYEEYRTTPNRIVGEMRTTRTGWYLAHRFSSYDPSTIPPIGDEFLLQNIREYRPWVYTSPDVDHFFGRIHLSFANVVPLPQVSKPYVW